MIGFLLTGMWVAPATAGTGAEDGAAGDKSANGNDKSDVNGQATGNKKKNDDTPTDKTDGALFRTTGEARLIGSLPPDVVVDTDGTTIGQGFVLDSRLRAGIGLYPAGWNMRAEFDLFDGQMAGDTWDISGDEDARHREQLELFDSDSMTARRLSVGGTLGPITIEGGLVTSRWGLGMLANDGASDPWFGRSDFGDRVLRLRFQAALSKQAPVVLVLAGDRVVEDELAVWSPFNGGQAAWQGVGALLWADPQQTYGIYGVYRHQTETDRVRVTEVGVLDGYADRKIDMGAWNLRLAGEIAGIFGTTDRAQSYNARDGLTVRSLGMTGLVALRPQAAGWTAMLRAGWASGDGDPDDGFSRDFTFDRDFDAGMVLFDELQGAIDAAAFAQLSDPANSGGAPDGAETLVGEGAIRRAAFLQPVLTGRLRPWFRLSGGINFAWATAPVAQGFATYRNGGVPVNHLGQPTDGYWLGTELDWSMTFGDNDWKPAPGIKTQPAILLQGGHLIAGENLGGGVMSLVTLTGRVRW